MNDISDGLPALIDSTMVATILAHSTGIAPKFGVVVLASNKKKFGAMMELGYEVGSVTKFRGKATGDLSGDWAVGYDSKYGVVANQGDDLPSGTDELKIRPGGFWLKFGFGINFGRPAVSASSDQKGEK